VTKDDKKAHARDALLEAAKQLFIAKGYEAVSTREIAELAGVNLGAIQYHFGSKAKLFVESVRVLMQGGRCLEAEEALQGECATQMDAAVKLCTFIEAFLRYLLLHEGPQPCRMMFREVFTSTSSDPEMMETLTSSVVNEFISPVHHALVRILGTIAPEMSQAELPAAAGSVIGQCSFYVTHRPFIARLRGVDPGAPEAFKGVVRHVAVFSLRGLGCKESFVKAAVEAALGKAKGSESKEKV
jgi:AcrR family transcriptional regulator